MDTAEYKNSNNKGFNVMFVILDNFSKYTWWVPLKNKYCQTVTDEFLNNLKT